jgi:hypothetical protein
MKKLQMEEINVGELLIGREYQSRIRTGFGEIIETKLRGDVHFPNGLVYAIRVSKNNYDPTSKEFWATVGIVA